MAAPTPPTFPELLRHWRTVRHASQLHLASDAEVSARHISFLENGRSRPSREMVLVLASALDVPLRDRNELLAAAGFSAEYTARPLDSMEMGPIRRAIDRLLRQHEPFPAVVLDRRWDVLQANHAAARLFATLLDAPLPGRPNLLRVMCDRAGVRRWVVGWERVAAALIERVHREAVGGIVDPDTRRLLDELVREIPASSRAEGAGELPIVAVHFRRGSLDLRFFSAVLTLGTPRDVTAEELRVEAFYPEDEQTERYARERLI